MIEGKFRKIKDHWKDKTTRIGCLHKEAIKALRMAENKESSGNKPSIVSDENEKMQRNESGNGETGDQQ